MLISGVVYLSGFSTCSINHVVDSYLAEDDLISVTCGVEFAGGWKPEITCEVADGRRIRANSTTSGETGEITSSFVARAEAAFDNRSIVCGVRFGNGMKPSYRLRVAGNVPACDTGWISDPLFVTCKSS